ncbi:MAG: type III-B CRISPR module RAMP protein Cmr4, partial [Nitrospinota bacterium]
MHDIMFTNFLTPAHPGSGTALGHIDRCIQREALNSYPMLQWRSIKGPLRAMLKFDEKKTGVSSDLAANFVFGKETEGASQLLIGDGNLLFYPAPVLKGLYLFFTSPAVLKRYSALSGDQIDEVDEIDTYLKNHEDCLCTKKTKKNYAVNNRFFTGGNFVLEPEIWNRQAGIEETLPGFSILKNFNKNLEEEIKERLVIVHDEMLKMLTLKTTEVRPNIKIENGLTVDGSLRYTEYL